MIELQRSCELKVEKAFRDAEAHYGHPIRRVKVTFSNRLTAVAGKAFYAQEIRLSNPLLKTNAHLFINETPGHEAAHIIAHRIYGNEGTGHGFRWKEVMAIIGLPAKRCHSFKRAAADVFKYVCDDGRVVSLSKIRHNKLQRGTVPSYHWKTGEVARARNYAG